MGISVEDYQRVKRKAERLKEEVSRAQGALEHMLARLKSEFECDTLQDGQKLLKEMETELKAHEVAYNTALAAFNEKWGDKL